MNWTAILAAAGIKEPPGRAEAVEEMARRRAAGEISRSWAGSRHTGAEQKRRAARATS